jgi:hypothetical protein
MLLGTFPPLGSVLALAAFSDDQRWMTKVYLLGFLEQAV